MSEEKEKEIKPEVKNESNKPVNKSPEILFETTYEKAIFIINKVKDYIKNSLSKESKLIEELDWVIKVIENRSLYNYELIKEKITKQNEEYNKFINFVKKYNEEVIEMNKKHDIVSSILNMRKKEEILMKPSLFLKKDDNINKVTEGKPKKENNFVHTFGNYILKLYHESNKRLNKIIDINEENNESLKQDLDKEESKENLEFKNNNNEKSQINNVNNNNEIIAYPQRKISLEKPKEIIENKKINKAQNLLLGNKNEYKKINFNLRPVLSESSSKRIPRIKLVKEEKNLFNNIKQMARNYYLNFAYKDPIMTNAYPYLLKNDFKNNNIFNSDSFKRYRNLHEKTYNLYKQNRQSSLSNNKNKVKPKHVTLNVPNINSNDNINNNSNNNASKNMKKDKYYILNKKYENQKNIINNRKIKFNVNQNHNNNEMKYNKNAEINKIKEEEKKEIEEKESLKTLISDNLEIMKNIKSWDFNIFVLKNKVGYNNVLPIIGYTILSTLGLIDSKIISTKKLESFLRTVSNSYKEDTLYHNSLHGADVAQSLLVFFSNSNAEEICETTVLDILGMIVSALGHDLGHPGLNNGFHVNASTELGITYNDQSCLENFHASFLFRIVRKEENNILEKFSVQNYKNIRKRMISQILATDMANHGQNISSIRAKIRACSDQDTFTFLSGNDKTKFDEQQLLLNYLIHMADLGHNCKKFEISITWIHLLCEEFWLQGDKEREKGLAISFMCDRYNIDVPASQIGFLKGFILSSFDCLVAMFPKLKFTTDNAENNINMWTKYQKEKIVLDWVVENGKKKEKNDNEE